MKEYKPDKCNDYTVYLDQSGKISLTIEIRSTEWVYQQLYKHQQLSSHTQISFKDTHCLSLFSEWAFVLCISILFWISVCLSL